MSTAALIFPHQLFPVHPALAGTQRVVLVEDPLFFRQYRFHRQKLLLHRVSMRHYADQLQQAGHDVDIVPATALRTTADIVPWLEQHDIRSVRVVDPCDDWLQQRLTYALAAARISITWLDDPHFLTPIPVLEQFVEHKKKLFFTEFYIQQRQRLQILLEPDGRPVGGQWSFDTANRKKLPKGHQPPAMTRLREAAQVKVARLSVQRDFPDAIGSNTLFPYPATREQALRWLDDFLEQRLTFFGDYEDAMSRANGTLYHSVLTPALNIGLINPQEVVERALAHADRVPLNSLEGFVRQVIGWREYMRLVYRTKGRQQRTRNFWGFTRPLPASFYQGKTGIVPVDTVIQRVLETGYCHHIERLMILGNFLLLCEVQPHDVYRWFMELFIDAYDWVMVPNVYGMSQHADGGLITTKPYLSGSSYVLKMSDFPKGDWCPIWDGLYWRFIHRHRDFFASNPRMAVMTSQLERMGSKLDQHLDIAERFLAQLG